MIKNFLFCAHVAYYIDYHAPLVSTSIQAWSSRDVALGLENQQ